MMLKVSWEALSMEHLFKSTLNWQGMKCEHLILRARISIVSLWYKVIGGASLKCCMGVGTTGQFDWCMGSYGLHSARSHV